MFRTKSSSSAPPAAAAATAAAAKTTTSSSSKRDLDLIVFGATGFTGKLVAEHLARHYSGGASSSPPSSSSSPSPSRPVVVRYALAGRDAERLARARDEVALHAPLAAGAELAAVDAGDHAALVALFSRARAVVSTAGPYSRCGTPIVRACVDAGAHYADITGELSWVASLRGRRGGGGGGGKEGDDDDDDGGDDDDDLDAKAKAKGVKLVPCCGYDCVPSDLGAFMVAEELKKRLSSSSTTEGKSSSSPSSPPPAPPSLRVAKLETAVDGAMMDGGGVSGGTAASALHLMTDAEASRVNSDPYVCFPRDEADGRKKKSAAAAARPYPPLRLSRRSPGMIAAARDPSSSAAVGWAVSWPLGAGNVAVVRRSAALLGYGRAKPPPSDASNNAAADAAAADDADDDDDAEVDVDETIEFPSLKHATAFDAGLAAVGAAMFAARHSARARRWVESKLPRPGQGPTREKMLNAPWRHVVVATAAAAEDDESSSSSPPPPMTVRGVVGGPQDRGYYMTARMVLEAGLALAFEAKEKEEAATATKEKKKKKEEAETTSGVFRAPPRAGILTPAAALGNTLIDRLRNAGFTFEIEK